MRPDRLTLLLMMSLEVVRLMPVQPAIVDGLTLAASVGVYLTLRPSRFAQLVAATSR